MEKSTWLNGPWNGERLTQEEMSNSGVVGYGWSGDWADMPDNGIRDPQNIDPDNVHSLFHVYALGDLGTGEHSGMLTGLERLIFETCWPGAKVSRHEINVHDGVNNAFKAEILSRRLKCNVETAQKFIEIFRGLSLRSQDIEKLLKEGVDGLSFYNPEDLPRIFIRLVDIDMSLPELPKNPSVEYTDEGYVRYKLGYNTHGQLVPEAEEEDDDWPDPEEGDFGGTPNAFRSIPIGWNARKILVENDSANGNILESMFKEVYEDPRERDFFDDWYPKQSMSYKKLYRGIEHCMKHADLAMIGKAMHADPEMEKLNRVQQSILWTKYSVQKNKLERRTGVFVQKLVEFVRKYPINKKFRIDSKVMSMGQLLYLYQKEQRVNLSGSQWSYVWKVYGSKKKNTFRPVCSELNI